MMALETDGTCPMLGVWRTHTMQLLYNSDSFAVMRFAQAENDGLALDDTAQVGRGCASDGYEIVDKHARKEIYLQGLVAESFSKGVMALVEQGPDQEVFDDFIAQFTVLAQQPVVLH
jgi:Protein of unknown function (DUF3567)